MSAPRRPGDDVRPPSPVPPPGGSPCRWWSGSSSSERAPLRVTVPLVALGGAAGGLLRWGAGSVLSAAPGQVPWATLAVNLSGCLLLGAAAVLLAPPGRGVARAFVATGLLGGYTTFSTYALEVTRLLDVAPMRAGAYAVGSVAGGLIGVAAGAALVRRLRPGRAPGRRVRGLR